MPPTNPNSAGQAPVVDRLLDLQWALSRKSHFLFEPRQTGKTWWIRHALPDARVYDLLDEHRAE